MKSIHDPEIQADLKARAAAGEEGAQTLLEALADPNTVYLTDADLMGDAQDSGNHCEHCDIDVFLPEEGDTHEQYACDDWQHRNKAGAEWPDGHCPACAERKRIADGIRSLHVLYGISGSMDHACTSPDEHEALERAERVARGES